MKLVIYGAPRTKKNHGQRKMVGKFMKQLPSEAWMEWRDLVLPQLVRQFDGYHPISEPVNVRALFYRDALRGDAVGYYQGLADVLEEAGVVTDDKWIVTWDGSRLRKDPARPRVELEITGAEE